MSSNVMLMDAQIKIIHAHLLSMDCKCACCGKFDIQIEGMLHEVRNFNVAVNLIDSSRAPLVTIICKKCGHMMFFSAIWLGVVPSENPNFKTII